MIAPSPTERPPALRRDMNKGRAVSEAVAWLVRARAEEWKAAEPGRTWAALAKQIGVSGAQVSDIRSEGRGVGHKTALGMSQFLGYTDYKLFERDAEDAYRKHHATQAVPAQHVERLARYPNCAIAAEFMRGQADPEAIERVIESALKSDHDLSPKEWADEIELEDRRLRRSRAATEAQRAAEGIAAERATQAAVERIRPPSAEDDEPAERAPRRKGTK